jgi:WD40 repeat protein
LLLGHVELRVIIARKEWHIIFLAMDQPEYFALKGYREDKGQGVHILEVVDGQLEERAFLVLSLNEDGTHRWLCSNLQFCVGDHGEGVHLVTYARNGDRCEVVRWDLGRDPILERPAVDICEFAGMDYDKFQKICLNSRGDEILTVTGGIFDRRMIKFCIDNPSRLNTKAGILGMWAHFADGDRYVVSTMHENRKSYICVWKNNDKGDNFRRFQCDPELVCATKYDSGQIAFVDAANYYGQKIIALHNLNDVDRDNKKHLIVNFPPSALCFGTAINLLACGGLDGSVCVWNLDVVVASHWGTIQVQLVNTYVGYLSSVIGMNFSRDSQLLACQYDTSTCVFNVSTGQRLAVYPRGISPCFSLTPRESEVILM